MKDFKGAAAGLRFADGGIELSFAGGGVKQAGDGKVGDHVGALPGDTAAVLALAVPEDALEGLGNDRGQPVLARCRCWGRSPASTSRRT